MKSVSVLKGGVKYNNDQLRRKDKKIENLECQMKNTSDVIPEATSRVEKKRLYSETVSGDHKKRAEQKTFKLTVKSKSSHNIAYMKTLVKTKVNPVEMKTGIITFKGLREDKLGG